MNSKGLTLNGKEVTVRLARVRDSVVIERLRQEAESAPVEDPDVQALRSVFYPVLAACTDGEIPSMDEFVDLPMAEGDAWFETVRELNPGLLNVNTAKTEEEAEAKKES